MNKDTTRPLLVEEVEKRRLVVARWKALQDRATGPLEDLRLARLRLAQAELQLWLADQQWARQEAEEREERPTEAPPSALPTTKT